jgi:hypothetical protein
MSDYEPKSSGVTLLRHSVAKVKSRHKNADPKDIKQLVSIPLTQAMDILDGAKTRRKRVQKARELADELISQLENEMTPHRTKQVQMLANNLAQRIEAIALDL